MDGFTLVAHCIWATVVAGFVSAYWYAELAHSVKKQWLERLAVVEGRTSGNSQILQATLKELGQIREGLEKLKAIPPKQPRL